MANKELLSRLTVMGVMTPSDALRMADYNAVEPLPASRSFTAAQVSNLTSNWTVTPKPIDTDIRNALRKLRARSRHESQNNDYVRRFLGLVKTNVVGAAGITLQARTKDPDGTADKLANAAIEKGWSDWGKIGSADVTGRLSWRMIQRQWIETMARDGEVLMRKVINWKGNKFRFALQFLDTELLDVNHNVILKNGNVIRMGIELDQWRKPVAYYLLTTTQTSDDYVYNGRRFKRIPAAEIYHVFLPEWTWQTRGIPWVSAGMLRLKMLGGYEEAELVASRAGASTFATYDPIDDESAGAPVGDLSNNFAKDESGEFIQEFESGTIGVTPQGYKLNLIDPQHPNSAYSDFVKACLRGIAAGLGVSYNSLANDLEGVNYNSLRKGALDDQDAWMLLQDFMVEAFCEVVYRDWLKIALLAGVLTVNGKPLNMDKEEKYQGVRWQPRRWQWVDPLKMMQANQIGIVNKVISPQMIIRETGHDPEEVLDDFEKWQQLLNDRGLKFETATQVGSLLTDSGTGNSDGQDNADSQNN